MPIGEIYPHIGGMLASSLVPVLQPASPNAKMIFGLFGFVFLISVIIFGAVTALIGISIIRFRDTGGGPPKQDFGNHRLQTLWTLPPVLIVLCLGILSSRQVISINPSPAHDASGAGAAALIVVGHQWWWEVRYPASGAVTANEIHVPIGKKLLVQVDSADVVHSFWIPQLGPKIDMVPGHLNFFWLEADEAGTFDGACSEFCGAQHAWMRFIVVAQSDSDYAAWIAQQARPAAKPVGPLAKAGQTIFFSQTCANCHAVGGTSAVANAAPDLTHFDSRQWLAAGVVPNTPGNLAAWLHDPQQIKPACKMPNFNLTDDQVNQLVAYLEGMQ